MEFMLSTTSFHSNPHIADYSAKIPGVKTLAGYVYDTLSYGDSVSQFSVDDIEIKFTQVDDSTLHFNINVDDRNFLKISDDEDMYYKSTDLVAQTVTFQTPNLYSIYFTTLTYNYLTGSIVFEHYRKIGNTSVHIKLQ